MVYYNRIYGLKEEFSISKNMFIKREKVFVLVLFSLISYIHLSLNLVLHKVECNFALYPLSGCDPQGKFACENETQFCIKYDPINDSCTENQSCTQYGQNYSCNEEEKLCVCKDGYSYNQYQRACVLMAKNEPNNYVSSESHAGINKNILWIILGVGIILLSITLLLLKVFGIKCILICFKKRIKSNKRVEDAGNETSCHQVNCRQINCRQINCQTNCLQTNCRQTNVKIAVINLSVIHEEEEENE